MGFKINRVYTRSGDSGLTGLVGGERVSKAHPRVEAYGTVDELNAVVGCIKEHLPSSCAELSPVLERLQQELFDLGAELATPSAGAYEGMWRASAADVQRLEALCDHYGEGLPELTSFILPGGSVVAGWLHLARTVARRAERCTIELAQMLAEEGGSQALNPEAIKYLNRLSDLFFVLVRWSLKREGREAPLWVPAGKRRS